MCEYLTTIHQGEICNKYGAIASWSEIYHFPWCDGIFGWCDWLMGEIYIKYGAIGLWCMVQSAYGLWCNRFMR